ncbi:gluconokinase [Brochothrix thermosphacta]|uniref:gluconokinase n=1 Tax=Brochothrix thermosphacta TaxID=2756 RepID=UPI0039AFC304
MTALDLVIGMDIGTTSTKGVLYDTDGTVIATSDKLYSLIQDQPDKAEQNPDEILTAVVSVISNIVRDAGVNRSRIAGVSFSSAMHSLILLDKEEQLVTQSITWADNRAHRWTQHIEDELNGIEIYKRTGTPLHPMSPLSKLLWLKNDEPALYKKARYFIGIKEYIFLRLFKRRIVDMSIASATGMYNIHTLDWDEGVLDLLEIDASYLSEVVETNVSITGLDKEYAHVMGLPVSMPFFIGASDGVLSNLGVNAIDGKTLALTIGTSGAVRMVVNEPRVDPKGRTFCYALTKDRWVIGGAVNNGGIVFRWVRDQLYPSDTLTNSENYNLLTEKASQIAVGSNGLIFHPFLGGERAPLWDADAKGAFIGLTHRHTRDHMIRAALEGIVFNLYSVLLVLEEIAPLPKRIHATGGFARSSLWRQLLADIFEQEVVIPESFESSCLGAAVLAMEELDLVNSLESVSSMVGVTHTHIPNKAHFEAYRELFPIFIRTTRLLQTEFATLADFQRKYTL